MGVGQQRGDVEQADRASVELADMFADLAPRGRRPVRRPGAAWPPRAGVKRENVRRPRATAARASGWATCSPASRTSATARERRSGKPGDMFAAPRLERSAGSARTPRATRAEPIARPSGRGHVRQPLAVQHSAPSGWDRQQSGIGLGARWRCSRPSHHPRARRRRAGRATAAGPPITLSGGSRCKLLAVATSRATRASLCQ